MNALNCAHMKSLAERLAAPRRARQTRLSHPNRADRGPFQVTLLTTERDVVWCDACVCCEAAVRCVNLNACLYLYEQGLHTGAIFMKPLKSEQRAANTHIQRSGSSKTLLACRNIQKQNAATTLSPLSDDPHLSMRARVSLSCALSRGASSSGSLAFPAAIFFSSSPAAEATASDTRHDFMESHRQRETSSSVRPKATTNINFSRKKALRVENPRKMCVSPPAGRLLTF